MDGTERKLILVSNRLPYSLQEKKDKVVLKQSDGGLVTALNSYFENDSNEDFFDEKLWIGSADFSEKRWEKFINQKSEKGSFSIVPLFIDSKVYNKFYNGFCNATLWPLFHYFNSYVVYDEDSFEKYREVNEQFAEKLIPYIGPNDVVWVHDYQLFLLPKILRERVPQAQIGFFLHIPFPSYEIFRLLHRKWKEEIVKGLLGADLIGFHTNEYVQHFLKTVRMITGYDHQYRGIEFGNRIVKVDLFPLGIDYKKFHDATQNPSVIELKESILKGFGERKTIFSVDRLDYTKGVTHRLSGFERFLERNPDWRGNVVFVLVVVPSRQIISKYNERRKLIEEQVGRINGRYSTLEWQPVIYRYNHMAFDELCAMYQAADIGLITPLRDGMNLVAKEYVASRVGQRGVLILSELAGAASELGEALMVNPMDTEEMSNALLEALTMPIPIQRHKMTLMQKRLVDYDVEKWVEDFLSRLYEVKKHQEIQEMKFITEQVAETIVEDFKKATKRYLFLDYDGTLVPFARHPREAKPGKELLKLLGDLASQENTTITIISGRDSGILEEWFADLPINMVAEHGASIKEVGGEWEHEKEIDQSWKTIIKPTLELFGQRCPGSFIEEKNHTLAWHYRNVEKELGFVRSRELLDNLYHLVRNANIQVIDGNKVIEVRIAGVDKGVAAKKLIEKQETEFTMVIGDDKTDEDMFRALADQALTIKVGPGHTVAEYHLTSHDDVIKLLSQLA